MTRLAAMAALPAVVTWAGCAPALRRTAGPGGAPVDLSARWVEPHDLRDAGGRRWDVEVGPEAQPEVHQPPTCDVTGWRAPGGQTAPARFRPASVGIRSYGGPGVANVILNDRTCKTSNNGVYRKGREGAKRRDVVQDLGASFGRPRWCTYGTRNDQSGVEPHAVIAGQRDEGAVRFHYHGRHREFLPALRPGDVTWTCGRLARLSSRQCGDAFRAAGYGESVRRRYVAKIRRKLCEGLALAGRRG